MIFTTAVLCFLLLTSPGLAQVDAADQVKNTDKQVQIVETQVPGYWPGSVPLVEGMEIDRHIRYTTNTQNFMSLWLSGEVSADEVRNFYSGLDGWEVSTPPFANKNPNSNYLYMEVQGDWEYFIVIFGDDVQPSENEGSMEMVINYFPAQERNNDW